MTYADAIRRRLVSQRLAGPACDRAEDVVRWFGAVQAQEYPGVGWAIAQRTLGLKATAIDEALAMGRIVRTHVMRPTWHFVAPGDIRWLLQLTAPRVHAVNAHMYRRLELDGAVLARSHGVLERVLRDGKRLTRREIGPALEEAGITAPADDRLRVAYIMMHAELEGLVCSGGLRGKQQTYALLEEHFAPAPALTRDEALAELAGRFYAGHGPATVKDGAWWSGLTMADVQAGIELAGARLEKDVVDGQTVWFSPAATVAAVEASSPAAHLLPAFDEYTVAYRDSSPFLDAEFREQAMDGLGIVIVIDGRIAGTWKRTIKGGAVTIETRPFRAFSEAETEAVAGAARRYGEFLELPVVLN